MGIENIHEHWEEKSKDNITSGTIDLIANNLEQNTILEEIKGNEKILEIGCGDGRNSINIGKKHKSVSIDAFDFSRGMINLAKRIAKQEEIKNINFFTFDINDLHKIGNTYDLIVSQRALINLESYKKQINAIENIAQLLNDDGFFLMCENSLNGLKNINQARMMLSLSEIIMPWHNKYFEESILEEDVKSLTLLKKKHFSSLYYFLSRVVNAYNAMDGNIEPRYDSPINKIALKLDKDFIDIYAQGVLWIWQKKKRIFK